MKRKYLVHSEHDCLGWFDSLDKAKAACCTHFNDNNYQEIMYYTICVISNQKLTRVHYSRIQFYSPLPDVRFPEFVLDYGQRNRHYILF